MSPKKVMLSAMQSTEKMTLGNYIGALKQWVSMQDQYHCYFFVGDLHALTVPRKAGMSLAENTLLAAATYVAAGIDTKRATLFVQSHVKEHAELQWVLNCHSYMGELNRMTQFKDKSAREGQNIPAGLFTYPVLMAADILLYGTHFVPVGADQKQHVELTRDVAMRMNGLFGDDLFVVPQPLIPARGARIMDLQDPTMKMSKSALSDAGTIFLLDPPEVIEKKLKRAVTDSGSEITYDATKPGIKNLIEIQSVITNKPADEIVKSYAGKQYGHLKVETAQIIISALQPIQKRIKELLDDRTELLHILREGAERARSVASAKVKTVYQRLGLLVE